MAELALVTLAAFTLDLILGDPAYGLHPIRLVGRWIHFLETRLRGAGLDGMAGGAILAVLVTIAPMSVFLLFSFLTGLVHPWAALSFQLYAVYSCLALGDLFRHIRPVVKAMGKNDMASARHALSRVVGRDVSGLDRWGMGRAAVETLAENFVDGFLSPLFWLISGGLSAWLLDISVMDGAVSAMLVFKSASTLDSMVGYRNARYEHFGRAGARLDDVMNFVPARLSIPLLFLGASISGLNSVNGIKTALRDRLKHDSPNAGHAESFAAGALEIRLGGDTIYGGVTKNKPWLGTGPISVDIPHIVAAVRLLRRSALIGMALILCPLFFL
jgi:adenosylcobinamide-phosphate synthase